MKDIFPLVNRKLADDGMPVPGHVIACSACGSEDFFSYRGGRMPTVVVSKKFRNRGWCVGDGDDHVCPTCAGTFRAVKPRPNHSAAAALKTAPQPDAPINIPSFEEAMAKSATVAPPAQMVRSPAAATGLGLLYMALADNFDPTKGRYRGDWSDEKVAKETGLALDFVRQRRESDFGPIIAGPDLDRLRVELVALENQHDGVVKGISNLNKRAEACMEELRSIAKQAGDAVYAANLVAAKIDAIKSQFAPVTP